MENIALKEVANSYPVWLGNFIFVYQKLSTDNLGLLEDLYHKDVTFIDPMHKVEGFKNLFQY
jgi:Holliday junction resolvasome RuvABC ATP-dependent DNA helicase subunit